MMFAELSGLEIGGIVCGIVFGASTIILGIMVYAKPAPTKIADDPAVRVEKVSKRYNHEAIDQRFGRLEVRLDSHDSEINAAWEEMKQMREANTRRYLNIAISLTEIKTHLGIKNKSTLTEPEE
jgi:hypothetical protein